MKEQSNIKHSIKEKTASQGEELARTTQAERLKREATEQPRKEPFADQEALEATLRNIDEVLDWSFVDELGHDVLDADALTAFITARELRIIRACVARALGKPQENSQ